MCFAFFFVCDGVMQSVLLSQEVGSTLMTRPLSTPHSPFRAHTPHNWEELCFNSNTLLNVLNESCKSLAHNHVWSSLLQGGISEKTLDRFPVNVLTERPFKQDTLTFKDKDPVLSHLEDRFQVLINRPCDVFCSPPEYAACSRSANVTVSNC